VAFIAALLFISQSNSYLGLLLSICLFFPASGAFVSLSQASLMDAEPDRHEQNMARWTLAGSIGVTAGPLLLGAAAFLGLGWRPIFTGMAVLGLAALALAWRWVPERSAASSEEAEERKPFIEGVKSALRALRRGEVLRWLVLLEFSDLMLDVLYSYLALYLVDVSRLQPETAALGVAIWTGVGLLGDLLLIPLLERVRGLDYLRVSVVIELVLFPFFLLAQPIVLKFAILGLLGFFNSGWYSVLMGRLYSAMPGQSATVMTIGNLTGWIGKLIPLGIGLVAQQFGLGVAMWILLAGPLALLVGLPRSKAGVTA
jgi:FSR family fosmidomycin resistance protein-like MFS transporter